MDILEVKQYRKMGSDLISLLSQIQLLVDNSMIQINENSDPASFQDALQQMGEHVRMMSQILHQNNQ